MKRLTIYRAIVGLWALGMLLGSLQLAHAQAAPTSALTSLEGVDGVFLVVDHLQATLESDGLYRSAIIGTAQRKLKAAGIPVLSNEELVNNPRQPNLHISVQSTLTGSQLHAYHLSIQFRQNVGLLIPSSDVQVLATTWEAPPITGAIARDQVEWVNDEITGMIDAFIRAYRMANPPAEE